jgi:hypothetical protein
MSQKAYLLHTEQDTEQDVECEGFIFWISGPSRDKISILLTIGNYEFRPQFVFLGLV